MPRPDDRTTEPHRSSSKAAGLQENSATGDTGEGRYAYEGLDRVIHEKARLGLMTSLAASPNGATFVELKELCRLTDGNLSRHLSVLEEAGLIELWKRGAGRTQQTLVRLTAAGRSEFARYLEVLEQVVRDAGVLSASLRNGLSPA